MFTKVAKYATSVMITTIFNVKLEMQPNLMLWGEGQLQETSPISLDMGVHMELLSAQHIIHTAC